MSNIKSKILLALACVNLLHPMLSPSSLAHAKKKRPPKAFSFFTEGGKASQGDCDGEKEIPRKRKHLKDFSSNNSYMGSELQTPEFKVKSNNDEMWKHFYKSKASCNTALAKTPSSIQEETLKTIKEELPPDEAADSDDEPTKDEAPDPE